MYRVLHLSEASERVLQSEIAKSRRREENSVVCFHLYLMALTVQSLRPHANVVGSFRDDDGDGKREQEKNNRLNQVKTKVLHAQNTFLYISVPSFHDYKVKFPLQATFYGGIKKAWLYISFSPSKLRCGPHDFNFTSEIQLRLKFYVSRNNRDKVWKKVAVF